MVSDVTTALIELVSSNLGPGESGSNAREQPNNGLAASLEGDCLIMTLTFRCGRRYCCMEWGCHLPLHSGKRWDDLRRILSARQVDSPDPLRLHLTVVVEEGAEFFDRSRPDPDRRGSYAFRGAPAQRYEVSAVEQPINAGMV